MQVNIRNLQTLFMNQVRYEIPLYQRRYVWEQEDQWDPLWEDVRNTSEDFLEAGMSTAAHFMGAVVLQNQPQVAGNLSVWSVVDGQQRLTTMQLLLDAVQEVLEQRGHAGEAARLKMLVLNNEAFVGDDDDLYFKVWPTMLDRDAFRQTMHNHLISEEYKDELIVRAHEFFKLQVNQWLDEDIGQTEKERANALEQTSSHLLQMVVIDLESSEEPHVIFETLNARGTPLLQSDLIKNMLMYEADQAGTADTAQIWNFDTEWWNEDVYQGNALRPRIDAFLNFWLTMRRQNEIAHNDVFAVFRRYFSTSGNSDVNAVAADIQKAGEAYSKIAKVEVSSDV